MDRLRAIERGLRKGPCRDTHNYSDWEVRDHAAIILEALGEDERADKKTIENLRYKLGELLAKVTAYEAILERSNFKMAVVRKKEER